MSHVITVRGIANAMGIFDVFHGEGVTWREDYPSVGHHVITLHAPRGTIEETRDMLKTLRIPSAKAVEA
jgi:hypothetical protein